jgi:hypothetical protein
LCQFHQILKNSALWKFDHSACLEYNSNLKLKLLFAICFHSCTISMLSSSWINLIKKKTYIVLNDLSTRMLIYKFPTTSIACGIYIYGVNFVKYWNRRPYGNLTIWLVVNLSVESYSNLKLKLVFAIHFYSCTISMLSSSWINVLKEETLHCQMMYQLECWYTSFGRCHKWNPCLWYERHQTLK